MRERVLKNGHKATWVKLNPGPEVQIDNKILDLVIALNELGMYTTMSCENNRHHRVWIAFHSGHNAEEFIKLVAENSPKLRRKALSATTQEYDRNQDAVWKLRGRWWVDSFVRTYTQKGTNHTVVFVHISVRFPRTQLEEITRIVTEERDLKIQSNKPKPNKENRK